jgi:hypothetical protein
MKRIRLAKVLVLAGLILQLPTAQAWDPQPTNPFPGVAYGAEIPGYTVTTPCQGSDCGIGIVPVVNCPPWSAADGSDGYSTGSAKRFCRNSWSPPTSAADDEDFRNRQQLAMAAATLESQVYNAAHPGEQKCVTWGPIVHANGISTSSGGVCANPVGTKSDGSTSQVAPSHVGSDSSGQVATATPPADSSTVATSSDSQTAHSQPNLSGVQTLIPFIDLTQYGFGRPFTIVVAGNLSASQCPGGSQAATNAINTGFSEYPATECWPDNAWAAYSIGGDIWSQFKSSNGAINAQAEINRRVQVNALRALALQQAQIAANETIGIKRCNSWNGYGESGQECAYIPVQNNKLFGTPIISSAGDSSTTLMPTVVQVGNIKVISPMGIPLVEWQANESYTAIICPTGSGKSTSLDLNGTVSPADDVWLTTCIKITEPSATAVPTETPTQVIAGGDTTTSAATPLTKSDTGTVQLASDPITFKGSLLQISNILGSLEIGDQESAAIKKAALQLNSIKSTSKLVKLTLPNSPMLIETAKSLTPAVCKISGLIVQPKKIGSCQISYIFSGESGNTFETTKKITFKK